MVAFFIPELQIHYGAAIGGRAFHGDCCDKLNGRQVCHTLKVWHTSDLTVF
jgi:hypothetical protein